ncbi:MAG: hypothetical protein U9Q72_02900 [Patescibacteria group bacterium]|nr:hypothetical protein [Patescibacteria group bacterium]
MFPFKRKRKIRSSRKPLNRKKIRRRRKPKIDLRTKNLLVSGRKTKLGLLGYRLSLILAGVALVYFIFFSPLLTVEEIIFKGDCQEEKQAVEEVLQQFIEEKHWGIFPQGHFFFLKKRRMEVAILEKMKSFGNVQIKKILFGKLEVTISKKATVILVCGQNSCTPLDKNGMALARIPLYDLPKYGAEAEIIHDESNSQIEIGKGISTQDQLQFIRDVKKVISAKNKVEIKELFIPLPSASEIKGKTAEGWLILFNTNFSLLAQSEALKIILNNEINPEDRICIEYVDLRITDKVYYRFFDDCENLKKEFKKKQEDQEKQEKTEETNKN